MTVRQQAERARQAFLKLASCGSRSAMLHEIAAAIQASSARVLEANKRDLDNSKDSLSQSLYKRLVLNEPKLRDVIGGIHQIADMPDPLGRVIEETELDEGLTLRKVQTPIGVIAAIFESRPDVVPQIAALALQTGNAVLLKGGKEAAQTNSALGEIISTVLENHGVRDAVQLVATREDVAELLKMDDLISLVVPRGSNEMVRAIQQATKIPVLGHAEGICHIFVDEFADIKKAVCIAIDSKTQYPEDRR
jgi:glutamate-5-semialdehyde dehydrogenase